MEGLGAGAVGGAGGVLEGDVAVGAEGERGDGEVGGCGLAADVVGGAVGWGEGGAAAGGGVAGVPHFVGWW